MSLNKKSYFQGGGAENEPTPGKKKYKSDRAILVQPRFEEPFYYNYDYLNAEGLSGDPQYGPGSGWNHIMEHKSIKDFLDFRRQRLNRKYVADDFWIEDNENNRKQRAEKMKVRASFLFGFIKQATDKNNIDFDIDSQVTPIIGETGSYPASARIGGYLDKYLPENDFEGKSPDKLDFGRDYTEDDEPSDSLDFSDLEELMEKYLTPAEDGIYGLPDGILPPEDKDSDATINHINPEAGETDSGNTMYEDKWNI